MRGFHYTAHIGSIYNGLRVLPDEPPNGAPGYPRVWVECSGCGVRKHVVGSWLLTGKIGCRRCHKWQGTGVVSGAYWGRLLSNARTRSIPVHLTIAQADALYAEQNGRCFYTGRALTPPMSADPVVTASLDRLDSARPYELGNVAWVHKHVNMLKRGMDHASFLAVCREVAAFRSAGHDLLPHPAAQRPANGGFAGEAGGRSVRPARIAV